eukprot:1293854-Rhodomonas_salina.1
MSAGAQRARAVDFAEIVEYAASRPTITLSPFEPRNAAASFRATSMTPGPEPGTNHSSVNGTPQPPSPGRVPSKFELRNSNAPFRATSMTRGPQPESAHQTPEPPSPSRRASSLPEPASESESTEEPLSEIEGNVWQFQAEMFRTPHVLHEASPASIEADFIPPAAFDDQPVFPWDRRPEDIAEEHTLISEEEVARRKAAMGIVRMHSGRALTLALRKIEDKGAVPARGKPKMVRERWKRSTSKSKRKGDQDLRWPAHDYEGSSSEEDEAKTKIFDLATGSKRNLAVQPPELIETHTRGPVEVEISMFNPISRINLPLLEIHETRAFENFTFLQADLVHADPPLEAAAAEPPIGGIGTWC